MTAAAKKEPVVPAPPDFFKPMHRVRFEDLLGELSDAIRDVESPRPTETDQDKRFARMRAARQAVINTYMESRP